MHRHRSVFASCRSHSFEKWLLSIAGLWKHELCRQRYQIASVRTVTKNRAEERSAIHIDLAIGLGILLLRIPLQYIVEGHRYNIFEDISCLGETYETPLPSSSSTSPPHRRGLCRLLWCVFPPPSSPTLLVQRTLIHLLLLVLSIKFFYNSRSLFRLLSASVHANLNLNRYLRLMGLAATKLLLTTPLGIWVLWVNVRVFGLSPWVSVVSVETLRWATVACALLFAYFSFADEAIKNYREAFNSVARRVYECGVGVWCPQLGWRNIQLPPLLPFLARSYAPRLHPKRHHPETRLIRLVLRHVRVVWGDLAAAEKALVFGADGAGGEKGTLALSDKESDHSSSSSSSASSASDTESVGGEEEVGGEEGEIKVSSLRRASVHIPTLPEPAHTRPASVRDAGDIV
ncbi:hypothetical protein B0H13DRAFT_2444779 [Mycena leptocephala]|nr:hypothetical protein B0H13DRAFT_2444779 [Mycena leptocephala]